MTKISSFTIAAGTLGTAALLKVAAFAAAVAMLGAATSAHAGGLGRPCTSAPQSAWLALETLQSKVEALGYTVQKAKLKGACGELYTIDQNGARVELFVDPTSGDIVGRL
jgi:hypothetical protein